jgi:hypothetical protein
MHIV